MTKVLGIDFGTSFSSCSYLDGGRPVMIPSNLGSPHIPSVVGFDPTGRFVVGEPARRQMADHPNNIVYGFKRFMGKKYLSNAVQDILHHFPFKIIPGPKGETLFELKERELSCEEIGTILIKELVAMAEAHTGFNGPVKEAIVSVPAYFNHIQRQSIRQACAGANLYVRKIINEPTAAAVAYAHDRDLHETALIYDLGGGTFDVTVMEIDGAEYRVLATAGDSFLGGLDFDNQIVEYWMDLFKREHRIDLSHNAQALQRIRDAAEGAKIDLSSQKEASAFIPGIASQGGKSINFSQSIRADRLEELCEPLVYQTLLTCQHALDLAEKTIESIDTILLVGGMSRMPLIRRKVEDFFGKKVNDSLNPQEAVSRGCAIQAGVFEMGLTGIQEVFLHDVLPISIGYILQDDSDYHVVFPKNHKVNSRKLIEVSTQADNQTAILMEIRQGDEPSHWDNELIGYFEFDGLPARPKGRASVEVEFFVDKQCMLTVVGRDIETGREIEAQF